MSNLLASLSTSGNALGVYQAALEVIQNNITNASTPGYAAQRLGLEALPFDVTGGLTGGVASQGLESSRDAFAEEQVRSHLHALGKSESQSQAISSIEALFDVSGTKGIPGALNELLQSFSAFSTTPSSLTARDAVLVAARTMADRIRALSTSLERTSGDLDRQIGSAVDRVNQLAVSIQEYNKEKALHHDADPALDARLNASLEELAEWTDYATVEQPDGQITVVLSGGSPLVVGEKVFPLESTAVTADAHVPPEVSIVDGQGKDVTGQIAGGKLAGLLDVRNRILGSLRGGQDQTGSINQFAKALADKVNGILEAGTVDSQAGADKGVALFVYDTPAASTIKVNPAITAAMLAPANASGSNGAALELAGLGSTGITELGGTSLVDFFGNVTAAVGAESAASSSALDSDKQAVAQMRTLRDEISGVSLDEQAVLLLQFQRSYAAAARVLTVLDQLTETTINLVR